MSRKLQVERFESRRRASATSKYKGTERSCSAQHSRLRIDAYDRVSRFVALGNTRSKARSTLYRVYGFILSTMPRDYPNSWPERSNPSSGYRYCGLLLVRVPSTDPSLLASIAYQRSRVFISVCEPAVCESSARSTD